MQKQIDSHTPNSRTLVSVLTFGALTVCALSPAFAQGPDPDQIYVQSITYGGTGCPQGTVGQSFANNRLSLTMIFDSFVASTGPGMPITESQKSCQINMNLHVPAGLAFTVVQSSTRGYVQLPAGVSAHSSTTYYLGADSASSTVNFTGPVTKDYVHLAETPPFELSSSECGGGIIPLNIKTTVKLLGPTTSSAQITLDSIDSKLTGDTGSAQGFDLVWTPCAPSDTTGPTVTAMPSVLPNANGWNNTDVEVYFDCEDSESGVDMAASDLGPFLLTESGTVTGTCVDLAGNITTESYTAQIDKDAPTIAIISPVAAGLYGLGATIPSSFSCTDTLSDIDTCDGPATLTTTSIGTQSFSVTATDLAGNTTTETLSYSIGGKNECKKNGWALFLNPTFSNQGQCVSSFVP